MTDKVKIVVNGREHQADPKKPLIRACEEAGAPVPQYCYHPGLTPVGSCRICQVEIKVGETPPRVVVACRTRPEPNMVVDTEAPKAHQARRECLEFLLKNHPLDCPICDKAGECTLQDYSFSEGQAFGRTVEPRRELEKRKDLGEVIVLDQERCILCSRCVRFLEEIPKSPQLVISQRGSHSVVETFQDRPLTGNYQGNLADVCPVGALTLKPFRFQARVWNLFKVASTCAECSRGCAITVEVLRKKDVKRFRPRYDEAVNGWWMCDVGRFAFTHANAPDRLGGAVVRGATGFQPTHVEDALELARDLFAVHGAPLVVLSPFLTQEEAERARELARRLGSEIVFVSPPPNGLADDVLHTGDPCPNRRGLVELGITGEDAATIQGRLAKCAAALLIGERVVELLSEQALAALPPSLRLVVLDCHAIDVPATDACIGIPNHVERVGHWINVDGVPRALGAARPAPSGVWLTTRLLDELTRLVTATTSRRATGSGAGGR